jgi:IclR family acetate operon transcriptional repressor
MVGAAARAYSARSGTVSAGANVGGVHSGQPKRTLEGVERTVRILHALRDRGQAHLAEVARDADLSESTASRYLASLCSFGYAERMPDNRYRLGWEVFRLGQHAAAGAVPRSDALPIMEDLLGRFNETVNLAYRKGDELVIVEVLHGNRAVIKLNEVGQVDPWHASALGKALLSTMTPSERASLIRRVGMPRLTPNTILDAATLENDLAESARRGYALDREEAEEDLTCVAAAVPATSGPAQFALSVSFLTHRLKTRNLAEVGRAIADAAALLGKRMSD